MQGKIHSNESLKFLEEIDASSRAKSIVRDGFKLPFERSMSRFWWKNNLSLFDHYDFAKKKIEEWDREGHIEKTETRPDFILVWPHVKCIGVSKSFVYALTVHISPIIY